MVLPPRDDAAPVILFDGDCNLCNGAVQFLLRVDRAGRFRFAAVQSAAARDVLARANAPASLPDSIVLVADGRVRTKSAAALAIARGLRFPWPLVAVFWLVPFPLRDLVYDFVARHRLRWFGKRRECWVPTPALRGRFLDADERHETGGTGAARTP